MLHACAAPFPMWVHSRIRDAVWQIVTACSSLSKPAGTAATCAYEQADVATAQCCQQASCCEKHWDLAALHAPDNSPTCVRWLTTRLPVTWGTPDRSPLSLRGVPELVLG